SGAARSSGSSADRPRAALHTPYMEFPHLRGEVRLPVSARSSRSASLSDLPEHRWWSGDLDRCSARVADEEDLVAGSLTRLCTLDLPAPGGDDPAAFRRHGEDHEVPLLDFRAIGPEAD